MFDLQSKTKQTKSVKSLMFLNVTKMFKLKVNPIASFQIMIYGLEKQSYLGHPLLQCGIIKQTIFYVVLVYIISSISWWNLHQTGWLHVRRKDLVAKEVETKIILKIEGKKLRRSAVYLWTIWTSRYIRAVRFTIRWISRICTKHITRLQQAGMAEKVKTPCTVDVYPSLNLKIL